MLDREELKRRREILVDSEDWLLPYAVEPYAIAVQDGAKNCTAAFARFDRLIYLHASPSDLFGCLHECVNHAGNLSKFFFPPKKKDKIAKGRAQMLKDWFAVKEPNPLQDRDLRNTLEHFDERLEGTSIFYCFGGRAAVHAA